MANRTIRESYRLYEQENNKTYKDLADVPALMTLEETAKLLRCCRKTVSQMIKSGELVAIERPGFVRVDKRSIEALLHD